MKTFFFFRPGAPGPLPVLSDLVFSVWDFYQNKTLLFNVSTISDVSFTHGRSVC